jgi:carboxymethylenebutenolidase
VVDRFAVAGFTALAPDLYHGKSTEEPDEAASLMMALHIESTAKELQIAAEFLADRPEATGEQVGIVGFCMGGQLATYAATLSPRIGAAVNYYGIHPNVKPDFAQLRSPLLGFFAERDSYASPEAVQAMSAELTQLGKVHEFMTYPGTDHAFFNDSRPSVYNAEAAEDSWQRMTAFFRARLSPSA